MCISQALIAAQNKVFSYHYDTYLIFCTTFPYCSPDLTWRDVMYLVVFTSNPSLTSGGSYTTNGAGIRVSRQFGFGVLDAEAMVTRARHWISVPPQLEHKRVPSASSGSVGHLYTNTPGHSSAADETWYWPKCILRNE